MLQQIGRIQFSMYHWLTKIDNKEPDKKFMSFPL